ncbi:hypothetical protein LIER_24849 [Lithospermum erythrorhizon]|uniref:RING-type domain-containing protein n=1 Tax=Lithospermum erythrorhizon TaxID=34254 RepID=A0AAV3R5N4_LITER
MGFPVGYTDIYIPKLLVHFLTLLSFFRKIISTFLAFFGLGDFLESENSIQPDPIGPKHDSLTAKFIRELLPVMKYSDIIEPPERCAVCLYDFDGNDEIRRLRNCVHIFHKNCLDRWLDHDQKTCPLCRTQFVPEDMQHAFNERLWLASGISDFYGEFSSLSYGL